VDDEAPRSRRCDSEGRGRRGARRCRFILFVTGGLLGPGYWLCGSVGDGHVFGRTPSEVRFTEFVLASVVVVVASWGLLLILGEALLFALAVVRADDRERYDIYRNLMILWGYVLTLGIPRHFRKLPAQFASRSDDVRDDGRRRTGAGPARRDRTAGRDRDRDGARTRDEDRPAARSREAAARRDRERAPEHGEGREAPRAAAPNRASARRRGRAPAADHAAPLGPIFPPRPAAEIEVAPDPVSAAPAVVFSAAGGVPESELRNALDLLLRYAAHVDRATPRPVPPEPYGIAAEAGGEP
jgi:hypothetical protein